jgi:hypothetical protein
MNIGASMDGVRNAIRDMAVRIIRQEAPELTEEQVESLTRAWVPNPKARGAEPGGSGTDLPPDLLEAMIDQFIAFSTGRMSSAEDKSLRAEIGPWPDRYWQAFPQVIRLIIRDFLNNEIGEAEFRSKIETAMTMGAG